MFEGLKSFLINWNSKTSERQKLQHCYLVLAFIIVLLAGIVSLFNADDGHDVVLVALFAVSAFVANGLVWNLLQSSVISKLGRKPKRK
jgi:cell division protein FtsW (lipid II flippase)